MSTINKNSDIENEVIGITTPYEKAKLRTEIEKQSITERMIDFWKDYEV